MIRAILGLAIVSAVAVGCESTGSSKGRNFKPAAKDTSLAAYAANSNYPSDRQALRDQAVTATIAKQSGAITIRNFTDKTMQEPRLWVNGVYVLRLRTVGPQSVITVNRNDMYNSAGESLGKVPIDTINRLELETEQNLIEVQGPQFD